MPRTIKRMPRGNAKYPWAKWLDGKPRRYTKGVDFHVPTRSFVMTARNAIEKQKLKIRVVMKGDYVYIGK